MKKPPIPKDENERIAALKALNILDTPIQESFERITRLVKVIYNVPVVAFSLVDSERLWFKSIQGMDITSTSREVSFCAHGINEEELFVVEDATKDERFSDNPSVTNNPKIRYYAGCPIKTVDHKKVGMLCIIDQKPRTFTEAELAPLRDLAALIESEINVSKITEDHFELREAFNQLKKDYDVDNLTRLYTRGAIEELLQKQIKHAEENQCQFGIAIIDIDDFKSVNDTYGHLAGDDILRNVAKRLLRSYRDTDVIGRWGGEEFIVVFDINKPEQLKTIADRARKTISEHAFSYKEHVLHVTITTGLAYYHFASGEDLNGLIARADKALYYGKNHGKDTVIEGSVDERLG